jgi:hypothetical protein
VINFEKDGIKEELTSKKKLRSLSSDSFKENHRLGVDKKATFVACSSISCNITITHADISLLKHPVLKDECQQFAHPLFSCAFSVL